jgi:hypothetical protein
MTDGFGLGCCFQWYMAGYISSLLVQHSFCDTKQSAWRDVLLGFSLIRTTPPSVENTKVSLFAWYLLWYSFVAMSSTNMLCVWHRMTRFAWWRQDLHAIELFRAHIGEWTMTRMLDYWQVMCFTSYRLNWNSWIWIPFPVDSDCTLLCSQVDRTRYSSIASGNNCIVQLCKCVSLHLKWALWIHPAY